MTTRVVRAELDARTVGAALDERVLRITLFDRNFGLDFAGAGLTLTGITTMGTPREAANSPFYQGEDEEVAYEFDFENWGEPVAGTLAVVLKDNTGTDVTLTNVTGAPYITATYVIVTGRVHTLTAGEAYRLEVLAEFDDGNTYEAFCQIFAEV